MLTEIPDLLVWTRFASDFISLAHAHQEPPLRANNGAPWTTWLMLGGRGAGKTRLGAEWVRAQATGALPYAEQRARHIALVGETAHDAREVMIEGPSGILRHAPRALERQTHRRTLRREKRRARAADALERAHTDAQPDRQRRAAAEPPEPPEPPPAAPPVAADKSGADARAPAAAAGTGDFSAVRSLADIARQRD